MLTNARRVVCWFSCGATSAVAAKLVTQQARTAGVPCVVAYCDPGSEHPDNMRFLRDVEAWIGEPVTILRSEIYADTWAVWEARRYIAGIHGAPCTIELKKRLRQGFEEPGDVQVFGFDAGEARRVERFRNGNPEVRLWAPLVDRGLSKPDCMAILERAGIELPEMYRLSFANANCVGCPKGGQGYWNKIRRHFPETFDRMARLERKLDAAICKSYAGDGKRKRVFLDELDPEAGRDDEPVPECGVLCAIAEDEIRENESSPAPQGGEGEA